MTQFLTGLLMMGLLASPDAGKDTINEAGSEENYGLSHAQQVAWDGEDLFADPNDCQVVVSAMLCEAEERKAATKERIERGPSDKATLKQLTRAIVSATDDIESAKTRLGGLDVESLNCMARDVHHLAICLGAEIVEPIYCQRELKVAAQLSAVKGLKARDKSERTRDGKSEKGR